MKKLFIFLGMIILLSCPLPEAVRAASSEQESKYTIDGTFTLHNKENISVYKMYLGENGFLTVTSEAENDFTYPVSWSSSDKSILALDTSSSTGICSYRALKTGQVIVTAQTSGKKSHKISIKFKITKDKPAKIGKADILYENSAMKAYYTIDLSEDSNIYGFLSDPKHKIPNIYFQGTYYEDKTATFAYLPSGCSKSWMTDIKIIYSINSKKTITTWNTMRGYIDSSDNRIKSEGSYGAETITSKDSRIVIELYNADKGWIDHEYEGNKINKLEANLRDLSEPIVTLHQVNLDGFTSDRFMEFKTPIFIYDIEKLTNIARSIEKERKENEAVYGAGSIALSVPEGSDLDIALKECTGCTNPSELGILQINKELYEAKLDDYLHAGDWNDFYVITKGIYAGTILYASTSEDNAADCNSGIRRSSGIEYFSTYIYLSNN